MSSSRTARPRSSPSPGARSSRGGASAARRCALGVLVRVSDGGAYADRLFPAAAAHAGLEGRDRAFAQALVFGTVQRRATLDWLLAELSSRPLERLDAEVHEALRLGLFQLLFLDSVPDRAAVAETVELAGGVNRGARGFANAVMRRATREARQRLGALRPDTPAAAAIRFSHPEWIAREWWDALGRETAVALLQAGNEPAESSLRANALVTDRDGLARALAVEGVRAEPADWPPEALVLSGAFDAHGSPLFASGAFMPQSRASALVARIVDPRPGERVLDLCSAPGAKTSHLAALMDGSGEVVAVERHPGRAAALEETCRRLRAGGVVSVRHADAREPLDLGEFDRVLLDPPCSGLGTLRGRPDARWRKDPEGVERLASVQADLLAAAASRVRAGGVLVYSTCTISRRENEDVVDAFLAASDGAFALEDLGARWPALAHPTVPGALLTLPHRDRTDGFFVARLRRLRAAGGPRSGGRRAGPPQ